MSEQNIVYIKEEEVKHCITASLREKLYKSLDKLNKQTPLNERPEGASTVMNDFLCKVQYGLVISKGHAMISFLADSRKELDPKYEKSLVIIKIPVDKIKSLIE